MDSQVTNKEQDQKSSEKSKNIRQSLPAAGTPVKKSDPLEIINRLHRNPESATKEDVIVLQSTIGNKGVMKLLSRLKNNKSTGKNNTNMPDNLKSGLETLSNVDLSDVRVHYNSDKPKDFGALAYTQGKDIHIAPGQEKHLPHEGWHAVQQKQGRAANGIVQAKFKPAKINANAHLRDEDNWNTKKGTLINKNSIILADDNDNKDIEDGIIFNTIWKRAINVSPHSVLPIPVDSHGYIRKKKVNFENMNFEDILKHRISQILAAAEARHPSLEGHLNKPTHRDFLLKKALRHDDWNKDNTSFEIFTDGFSTKETKMNRIREGAEYAADSLEYWRKWMHKTRPNDVTISDVEFKESDLHERGLGVMKVKFIKATEPVNHKFSGQAIVEVMIKPENKSLEQNLLGDHQQSAANKINRIAGLTSPDEKLSTIRMESTAHHGSLVEKVDGKRADDNVGLPVGRRPIKQSFHETLLFVFLAGIDDLHHENVLWKEGIPYLIDADNILSRNQMLIKDNGKLPQTGFEEYNPAEAAKNKAAITGRDFEPAVGGLKPTSKIFAAMQVRETAMQIKEALLIAMKDKKARVVPLKTTFWATKLTEYQTLGAKDIILDACSHPATLVGKDTVFDSGIGPGLFGTSGKAHGEIWYDQAAEKEQLRHDFEAGVIPFYEYQFNDGFVLHNGVPIYKGQTAKQALKKMLKYFGH